MPKISGNTREGNIEKLVGTKSFLLQADPPLETK
jgi:hypothetical protein